MTSSASVLAPACFRSSIASVLARGRVDVPAVLGELSAVARPIPVEQPVISTGLDLSIPISFSFGLRARSLSEPAPLRCGSCERSPSRRRARCGSTSGPIPSCSPPTTRSCGSRRAASAARTSTSTTGGCRSSPASSSATSTSGEVVAAGDEVTGVSVGDRVLGTYGTACGEVLLLRARRVPQVRRGTGLRPRRDARLAPGRPGRAGPGAAREPGAAPQVPEGLSDDVALFAGDVMGTAYHAIDSRPLAKGETAAILGLGPVGLCAVQAAKAAGASEVIAIDTVEERLKMAESFGATPVHLTEDDPRGEGEGADRGAGRRPRGGRRRPPRGARPRLPARPEGRDRLGDRRLRRADRAPHGGRLDQGAHPAQRPRQRDQARRSGARAALERRARSRPRSSPTT